MSDKFKMKAVARCTSEIERASLYSKAIAGIAVAETDHAIDFIRLAYIAMYDQMITHAIKVLDRREKAGLYALMKLYPKFVVGTCSAYDIELDSVSSIVEGLQHIRDKTHMHLDKKGVLNPEQVWSDAGITRDQFDAAISTSFQLLCHLHEHITSKVYVVSEYDGTDATRIAEHAYQNELLFY